jgi:8-oxo-dGTP diphosphatase
MRGSPTNSIDVVVCAPHGRQLAVLLVRDDSRHAREKWCLPWAPADPEGPLDREAARLVVRCAGAKPAWIEQAGAFADGTRHPGDAAISVAYAGVTPERSVAPAARAKWFDAAELPSLAPRHRAIVQAALAALRERMDRAPVAFRLLGPTFTLSDLQAVYELLLGRRLHKASFRRSLTAAFLVEPTDEWRSEGRGRPAQLYRYAPRKRRGGRGGVRFELLGG